MLREIYEQPSKLSAALSQYLDAEGLRADTCGDVERWISNIHSKLRIAASGSSRHAGMIAEQIIEDISGIPVDVEYASKHCYRSENALADAAVMAAISRKSLDASEVQDLATHTVYVKEMREALVGICEMIPLQLLSYWMAINNGIDFDHPRNLTKVVLAE